MKRILTFLCCLLFTYSVYAVSVVSYFETGSDTYAPSLSSFVIGADGETWTFTYNENVTASDNGDMCDGFDITMSTSGALTFTYGSGIRGATHIFTCTSSSIVNSGETITDGLNYIQGTISDNASNTLAAITDKTTGFTNNSEIGAPELSVQWADGSPVYTRTDIQFIDGGTYVVKE